jgi:hypothetical protein
MVTPTASAERQRQNMSAAQSPATLVTPFPQEAPQALLVEG